MAYDPTGSSKRELGKAGVKRSISLIRAFALLSSTITLKAAASRNS